MPRIFQTQPAFFFVDPHEGKAQLDFELHSSSVIKLKDFLPEKKHPNRGRWECGDLVVMHSPVPALKQLMRLQVKEINVPGVIGVTWIFIGLQAVEQFGRIPEVFRDRMKPSKSEYRRGDFSLSRFKVTAVGKYDAETKADRNDRREPLGVFAPFVGFCCYWRKRVELLINFYVA